MENRVVLITGASSGIGKSTAHYLMTRGFKVYGTSRKALSCSGHTHTDPKSGGFINMVPLDVTSDISVDNAIKTVLEREGRIDILISNAGTGIAGSVEDTSIEQAKEQFEINYFGSLRVIKAVLPVMRNQGGGKIIALSSIAGVISIPYQGHYSSSKFAVEGIIEALRYEVAPFNIDVCLIEPGDTKTEFTGNRQISESANESSPYYERFKRSLARMEHDEQNGASPQSVAKVIYKMITRKKTPLRSAVGFQYKFILFLRKILPFRIVELAVGKLYN